MEEENKKTEGKKKITNHKLAQAEVLGNLGIGQNNVEQSSELGQLVSITYMVKISEEREETAVEDRTEFFL